MQYTLVKQLPTYMDFLRCELDSVSALVFGASPSPLARISRIGYLI